ncbi:MULTISPECIES: FHA domain-containing protein [Filomicrobium]|nr:MULTISPECIES: FHA domain-containing protein [Filomicrobium]MCV0370740.1 FHA domain-containing protein [Filomicrobium sp.]SDP55029.1 Forkhead associated (FHA) domain, binds pSer, pThr, pTyr [Filomicrobium insigne]
MPIWDIAADWQGDLLSWWQRVTSDFGDLLGQGYGQAPALLLGLSLVVIVPLFVAAGLILRRSGSVIEPDRTVRYPAAQKLPTTNPPPYSHRVIVPGDAFVQIQETSDAEVSEFRFSGALMVRIGREEDNDVRLTDPTVHRYHAVISRSADVGYVVSDLSSSDGNGVIVNGERIRRQRLKDGDVITLGTAKLTFRLQ